MTRRRALAVAVVAFAWAGVAGALPPLGTSCPQIRLRDAWERSLDLRTLIGKPVLVVYEDKDSASQNQPLKDELAELAKGDRYRARIALVAVADVSAYDFWPVRGFVKDAIRDESRRFDTTIYCDWDGDARRRLGVVPGASNVVLYGKDGRALFAQSGPLSAASRRQLVDLLRALVDG